MSANSPKSSAADQHSRGSTPTPPSSTPTTTAASMKTSTPPMTAASTPISYSAALFKSLKSLVKGSLPTSQQQQQQPTPSTSSDPSIPQQQRTGAVRSDTPTQKDSTPIASATPIAVPSSSATPIAVRSATPSTSRPHTPTSSFPSASYSASSIAFDGPSLSYSHSYESHTNSPSLSKCSSGENTPTPQSLARHRSRVDQSDAVLSDAMVHITRDTKPALPVSAATLVDSFIRNSSSTPSKRTTLNKENAPPPAVNDATTFPVLSSTSTSNTQTPEIQTRQIAATPKGQSGAWSRAPACVKSLASGTPLASGTSTPVMKSSHSIVSVPDITPPVAASNEATATTPSTTISTTANITEEKKAVKPIKEAASSSKPLTESKVTEEPTVVDSSSTTATTPASSNTGKKQHKKNKNSKVQNVIQQYESNGATSSGATTSTHAAATTASSADETSASSIPRIQVRSQRALSRGSLAGSLPTSINGSPKLTVTALPSTTNTNTNTSTMQKARSYNQLTDRRTGGGSSRRNSNFSTSSSFGSATNLTSGLLRFPVSNSIASQQLQQQQQQLHHHQPRQPYLMAPTLPRLETIKLQLEYYFSSNNLAKDLYLRQLMNSRGYVPIAKLLEFPRLKSLTTKAHDILTAASSSLHLKTKNAAVRSRGDWQKYVLNGPSSNVTDDENEEVRERNMTEAAAVSSPTPSSSPSVTAESPEAAQIHSQPQLLQQQSHSQPTILYYPVMAAPQSTSMPSLPYYPAAQPMFYPAPQQIYNGMPIVPAPSYPPHLMPVFNAALMAQTMVNMQLMQQQQVLESLYRQQQQQQQQQPPIISIVPQRHSTLGTSQSQPVTPYVAASSSQPSSSSPPLTLAAPGRVLTPNQLQQALKKKGKKLSMETLMSRTSSHPFLHKSSTTESNSGESGELAPAIKSRPRKKKALTSHTSQTSETTSETNSSPSNSASASTSTSASASNSTSPSAPVVVLEDQ